MLFFVFYGALFFLLAAGYLCADSRTEGDWELKMTFAGDIMAHSINADMDDYRAIYEGIRDIFFDDDLTFANLEFSIDHTRENSGYPNFNVKKDYVAAALYSGIDVFSLANNHSYDHGVDGIFQSIRSMYHLKEKSAGAVYFSGIRGNSKRRFQPEEITLKGIKIGFLAVTQYLNRTVRSPYVNIVDYNNTEDTEEFFDLVREMASVYHVFIVSYHGGAEYEPEPEKEKVRFFHRLVQNGADIVFGHHPHVVQGYEKVEHEGLNKLILYSTGNLISGMSTKVNPTVYDDTWAPVRDSALFCIRLAKRPAGIDISDVIPILISNYKNGNGDIIIGEMGDLAEKAVSSVWREYYHKRMEIMGSMSSEKEFTFDF